MSVPSISAACRDYLEAKRKALPFAQRLFASAIPIGVILQIVPLVIQILAALGISIPWFGRPTFLDPDLLDAMRSNGLDLDSNSR